MQRQILVLMACVGLFGVALTGCNSSTPAQTTKDVASFKGGPMPPEARQKMMEAMQQARAKSAQPTNGTQQ